MYAFPLGLQTKHGDGNLENGAGTCFTERVSKLRYHFCRKRERVTSLDDAQARAELIPSPDKY